jgi:uncharacterized protein YegP (UPF0339 family)
MKYQMMVTAAGFWSWTLRTSEGELVASGSHYLTQVACLDAITSVKGSFAAPIEVGPSKSHRQFALQSDPDFSLS